MLDGAPEELRNGRILSTALDDRAGIYVCLEALRRLSADPPASIPLRYMHSAGEVAQLSDVDAASRLIEAYIRSLTAETSFLRETGESLSPATLAG